MHVGVLKTSSARDIICGLCLSPLGRGKFLPACSDHDLNCRLGVVFTGIHQKFDVQSTRSMTAHSMFPYRPFDRGVKANNGLRR